MSDLVNRKTLIGAIEKCGEKKIYPQALIQTIKALPSADRPSADVVHKPDYSYEADMVKRLKEATSADRPKVAYICDGRKCDEDCSECFRTTDIEHARDFKLLGDTYYQQEQADRHEYNLESIADIVKQLGHLDSYIANMCERQIEHDGCDGCQHEHKAETEYPCTECKQNYRDKYRRKENTSSADRPKEDSKPEPYVPEASTERVVHCKDCIYSRQPEGEELFVCESRLGMTGWVKEDDFCSSGSL